MSALGGSGRAAKCGLLDARWVIHNLYKRAALPGSNCSHALFSCCKMARGFRSGPMLNVKRRQFISVLVGAAAWPLAARAQRPNVATIGVMVRAAPGWERFWQLFPKALRDIGYIEGK